MKIVKVKINDLISPDYNPRTITDEELSKLKDSLEEFGYISPIIVNQHNNHIVGGNQRYECLKALGYDEIDVIYINEPDLQREKALNIRLNNLSGEWDTGKLETIFNEFESTGFNTDLTGFNTDNLQGFHDTAEDDDIEVIEDDFEIPADENDIKTHVAKGDLYKLGNHRLLCGDSTIEENVKKLMNGEKADMVFTDPPYSYEYQSNMRTSSNQFEILKNDDNILNFFPVLKKYVNGWIFIATTWKVLDKWLELFKKYFELTNLVVWYKGGGGIGDLKKTYLTDYELFMVSNNGQALTGKRIGSVWNIPKDNPNEYIHPTQKPINLSATAIQTVTTENDNVLDLFGGSGSTLIACEQLNRNCYMMELDPYYCQVIINRWEEFTGKQAVKIN